MKKFLMVSFTACLIGVASLLTTGCDDDNVFGLTFVSNSSYIMSIYINGELISELVEGNPQEVFDFGDGAVVMIERNLDRSFVVFDYEGYLTTSVVVDDDTLFTINSSGETGIAIRE